MFATESGLFAQESSYTEARPYAGAPGGRASSAAGRGQPRSRRPAHGRAALSRLLLGHPVIPTASRPSGRIAAWPPHWAAARTPGCDSDHRTLEVAPPAFEAAPHRQASLLPTSAADQAPPLRVIDDQACSPSSCQYPSPSSPPSSVPSSPPESADAHRLTGRRSDTATPVGTLEAETLEETFSTDGGCLARLRRWMWRRRGRRAGTRCRRRHKRGQRHCGLRAQRRAGCQTRRLAARHVHGRLGVFFSLGPVGHPCAAGLGGAGCSVR